MHFFAVALSALLPTAILALPTGQALPPTKSYPARQASVSTSCDLSNVQLPFNATSPELTGISAGLSLKKVVIGQGTQNYTCSSATASETPSAVGAVATFYDASCLVSTDGSLLSQLTGGLVEFSSTSSKVLAISEVLNEDLVIGHHFFENPKTPVFDFRMADDKDILIAEKTDDVDAPSGSVSGTNGAVDWLKVTSKSADSVGLTEGYRIFTAGGSPPTTCEDQDSDFTVSYAAEYWFYG
ncbi:MAG: hypothetical protein M1834_001692 [Cirrosporium novae-zelandiae]|nr:MAG: hypothetical protein M1834_001692 [Cirrosporium novae-zelandiae]